PKWECSSKASRCQSSTPWPTPGGTRITACSSSSMTTAVASAACSSRVTGSEPAPASAVMSRHRPALDEIPEQAIEFLRLVEEHRVRGVLHGGELALGQRLSHPPLRIELEALGRSDHQR